MGFDFLTSDSAQTQPGTAPRTLERRLDLPAVIALSLSSMLGSGIFVLPGLAAAKTGPSVWLAYVVAGVCVLPTAISKSELTTAMPTSGGTYVYLERAFGPLVGTVAGLGLWLSLLLKSSFALVGLGAYLVILIDLPLKPTALVLLAAIVFLNMRGVKGVSRVQVGVIAVSLVGLAGLAIAGAGSFDPSRLEDSFRHGAGGFLTAVGFVFVSYAGVTKIAAIAEEVKDPERNLPRGILLSLLVVTAIYGGVALILAGVIPLAELESDVHPLYTLAEHATGIHAIGIAVAILGVVTMASMANAGLLAASRFPFAMSREQLLPHFLSQIHPRHLTPIACIAVSGCTIAGAILLFDIERIAKLASAFMILIYIAENAAVVVLRETRVRWYKPKYRSPLYPWVQILGIVSGLVLAVALGPAAITAAAAIVVPGMVLFFLYGRGRTSRLGVVAQRRERRQLIQEDEPLRRRGEEDEPPGRAAVVIALFGKERSPEMLVDIGWALAEGGRVQVVYLTEIPEQALLDAIDVEDPIVWSVRRRITAMAHAQGIPLSFEALVSRDIVHSVHELVSQFRCRWLVVEWAGRTRGAFSIHDQLGWLRHNLPCNLATFSDAGVRYTRRILVDVSPGPHDALVLGTADRLAEVHGAHVTFSRFVQKDATRATEQSEADYLDQVRELCSASSDTAVLRAANEESAIGEASASYDLVVTSGRQPPSFLGRILRTPHEDRVIERALCSVVSLQAPRASAHGAFERYRPRSRAHKLQLGAALDPRCIEIQLAITKKEALFREIAEVFASALPELTTQAVLSALWAREETQNTSLGMGLALPHATLGEAEQTYVGVFTTSAPIAYGAPDGGPIDVFVVTLGPPRDRQAHLVLLSSLSKLVLKTPLLERVRGARESADVLAAIQECSAEIEL